LDFLVLDLLVSVASACFRLGLPTGSLALADLSLREVCCESFFYLLLLLSSFILIFSFNSRTFGLLVRTSVPCVLRVERTRVAGSACGSGDKSAAVTLCICLAANSPTTSADCAADWLTPSPDISSWFSACSTITGCTMECERRTILKLVGICRLCTVVVCAVCLSFFVGELSAFPVWRFCAAR